MVSIGPWIHVSVVPFAVFQELEMVTKYLATSHSGCRVRKLPSFRLSHRKAVQSSHLSSSSLLLVI